MMCAAFRDSVLYWRLYYSATTNTSYFGSFEDKLLSSVATVVSLDPLLERAMVTTANEGRDKNFETKTVFSNFKFEIILKIGEKLFTKKTSGVRTNQLQHVQLRVVSLARFSFKRM